MKKLTQKDAPTIQALADLLNRIEGDIEEERHNAGSTDRRLCDEIDLTDLPLYAPWPDYVPEGIYSWSADLVLVPNPGSRDWRKRWLLEP